ncbi:MAG: pirin family protein [Polyangiaceae bacterium]
MNPVIRPVLKVVSAHRQEEGAGFVVRRPFPSAGLSVADPFLMLDELGPVDYAPGQAIGAPDHPHRGFETVSYILEGEVEHEDSAGHRGIIGAGDVQWMTAGRGVIHSEMPTRQILEKGGRVHGFQIWVNLPARDKMMAPRYQEVPKAKIPEGKSVRARVKVVAGSALGVDAAIDTRTPIALHDWTLDPGALEDVTIPTSYSVYVYVFSGTALVDGQSVVEGQLAVLGRGDIVRLGTDEAEKKAARLLLLAGEPIREPVVSYGPFVMNTKAEILQAVSDYQNGKMGEIARTT